MGLRCLGLGNWWWGNIESKEVWAKKEKWTLLLLLYSYPFRRIGEKWGINREEKNLWAQPKKNHLLFWGGEGGRRAMKQKPWFFSFVTGIWKTDRLYVSKVKSPRLSSKTEDHHQEKIDIPLFLGQQWRIVAKKKAWDFNRVEGWGSLL